jgi:hypothetical protein
MGYCTLEGRGRFTSRARIKFWPVDEGVGNFSHNSVCDLTFQAQARLMNFWSAVVMREGRDIALGELRRFDGTLHDGASVVQFTNEYGYCGKICCAKSLCHSEKLCWAIGHYRFR